MRQLPKTVLVTQSFARPRVEPGAAVRESFSSLQGLPPLRGKRVAVAAGSRGIDQLQQIVRTTLEILREQGAEPFLVPAMGSHGGATAEGQAKILQGYGLSAEELGVPVVSTMETRSAGVTEDGVPVPVDRAAFDADGIVLVNRVKPHTDFKGETESGLQKMIAVGLGNRAGADSFHSWTLRHRHDHLIQTKAALLLATGKVLFGVAVLENAYHETARIELIGAAEIPRRENALLLEAKALMPSLPVAQADILIVDRIGKDVSGSGMDPNVTGRWFGVNTVWQDQPDITRIIVLDLTDASEGNAVGIGLADFCSRRLVSKMDREKTYLNAITSRNVFAGHIPLHFESDLETVKRTLDSLPSGVDAGSVRLLRIRDTLSLDRLEVSTALLPELAGNSRIHQDASPREMSFNQEGALLPFPATTAAQGRTR